MAFWSQVFIREERNSHRITELTLTLHEQGFELWLFPLPVIDSAIVCLVIYPLINISTHQRGDWLCSPACEMGHQWAARSIGISINNCCNKCTCEKRMYCPSYAQGENQNNVLCACRADHITYIKEQDPCMLRKAIRVHNNMYYSSYAPISWKTCPFLDGQVAGTSVGEKKKLFAQFHASFFIIKHLKLFFDLILILIVHYCFIDHIINNSIICNNII